MCGFKKVIIPFIILFLTSLSMYIYNPYLLLRPLQIIEMKRQDHQYFISKRVTGKRDIPLFLLETLRRPNNFIKTHSFTKKSMYADFIDGKGNCSTLSYGAGVLLESKNINYSIVHLLPKHGLFEGRGHTILLYQDSSYFLLDSEIRSIPMMNDEAIIFSESSDFLKYKNKFNFLNIKHSDIQPILSYYSDENTVAIAYVCQKDLDDFYDQNLFLLDLFDLKETEITKILVNSIACMTFKIPTIKVSSSDYAKLKIEYPELIWLKIYGIFFILNSYFLTSVLFISILKVGLKKINY